MKPLTDKWRGIFVKGIKSINYVNETPICSFQLIVDLLKNYMADKPKTINQLKEILLEQYINYKQEIYKIGHILISQGKPLLANKLLLGTITLETMIMSEDYYMTTFDLLLFAKHFKLPLVLLSSLALKENNKLFLIANKNVDENYYFVLIQPTKVGVIPQYNLFNNKTLLQINIKQINLPMQTEIKISSEFNIDSYIKEFKVKKIKIPVKIGQVQTKLPSKKIVVPERKEEEDEDEALLNALLRLDRENEIPLIRRPASK